MLRALLNDAGSNVEKAKKNIETWFDDQMERVTGWYKRKVRLIVLVCGILITILLNVNTLALANSLTTNPDLAAAVADAASKFVSTNGPDGATPVVEVAEVGDVTDVTEPPASSDPDMTQMKTLTIHQLKDQLNALALPIGWQPDETQCTNWQHFWGDLGGCTNHLFGLLVTGVLVSFGAPFWFDILSKIISLRGNGDKPKTEEDAAANVGSGPSVKL